MSCSRTQHSDLGEARTRCPSVSSQALSHCTPQSWTPLTKLSESVHENSGCDWWEMGFEQLTLVIICARVSERIQIFLPNHKYVCNVCSFTVLTKNAVFKD